METGNGTCSACPAGKTTGATGAISEDSCSVCTTGYTPGADGVGCEPCPVGSFKQGNGTGVCERCPIHKTTPGTGASSLSNCSICEPGYEGPSCQPKVCETSAASGHHSGCPTGNFSGPVCTVVCDRGYDPQSGSGIYSCNATGAWHPEGGELACGRSHNEQCPPHDSKFPATQPPAERCDVVSIVGVAYSDDKNITENDPKSEQWEQGLHMFADHANQQGGLRMGHGSIGYVHVHMRTVDSDDKDAYRQKYLELCQDPDVDVLVGPLDSGTALAVLRHLHQNSCDKLFLLASSGIDAVFDPAEQFTHAWSVYGKVSHRGADVVDFLAKLDPSASQAVAIAGENTDLAREWLASLKAAIDSSSDLTLENLPDLADKARFPRTIKPAADTKPDIFIGLGDTFEALLRGFKLLKYAPRAAFLAGGLDVSEFVKRESYNQPDCAKRHLECWVPNQWMGTLPWSHEMQYEASRSWAGIDAYGDAGAGPDGADRRFSRYMGSAEDFYNLAKERLGSSLEPTHYHAQAAATLLMMQMAIELAPSAHGWGVSYEDLRNVGALKAAMTALDVQTFWGPIRPQPTGHNAAFRTGIAQVTQHGTDTAVHLVGAPPARSAAFPARWPCELSDSCHTPASSPAMEAFSTLAREHKAEVAAICVAVLVLAAACIRWCNCSVKKSALEKSVLRESLLGGVDRLPDAELAVKDVQTRWVEAARQQILHPDMASVKSRAAAVPKSTRREAKRADDDAFTLVMFGDAHVPELQPSNWREQLLGKGSFGAVYRASWRGEDVAVKELMLPTEPLSSSGPAKAALAQRVQQIAKDFVSEVEVCADLAHPNLVRLMGYSSKPRLLIVQEMMHGQSVDKQLYVERWRPTHLQLLKVALDVAQGMKYLHSHFKQPIIHRDLKCGNLLLRSPPDSAAETSIVCKVADFGLSRDKHISDDARTTGFAEYREGGTEQMTGCGSVLWMAPEILQGDTYNESVDVFSFAMCMVELIDCDLPWHGWRFAAEVPFKVIQNERPTHQIRSAPSDELRELVTAMWRHVPSRRPSFHDIVERVEGLYAGAGGRR